MITHTNNFRLGRHFCIWTHFGSGYRFFEHDKPHQVLKLVLSEWTFRRFWIRTCTFRVKFTKSASVNLKYFNIFFFQMKKKKSNWYYTIERYTLINKPKGLLFIYFYIYYVSIEFFQISITINVRYIINYTDSSKDSFIPFCLVRPLV